MPRELQNILNTPQSICDEFRAFLKRHNNHDNVYITFDKDYQIPLIALDIKQNIAKNNVESFQNLSLTFDCRASIDDGIWGVLEFVKTCDDFYQPKYQIDYSNPNDLVGAVSYFRLKNLLEKSKKISKQNEISILLQIHVAVLSRGSPRKSKKINRLEKCKNWENIK